MPDRQSARPATPQPPWRANGPCPAGDAPTRPPDHRRLPGAHGPALPTVPGKACRKAVPPLKVANASKKSFWRLLSRLWNAHLRWRCAPLFGSVMTTFCCRCNKRLHEASRGGRVHSPLGTPILPPRVPERFAPSHKTKAASALRSAARTPKHRRSSDARCEPRGTGSCRGW
jgi:hypothetical protein